MGRLEREREIGVLESFAKFNGKHPCRSLFLMLANLLVKRRQRKCFPVNFAKFLRTTFFRIPLLAAFERKSQFHQHVKYMNDKIENFSYYFESFYFFFVRLLLILICLFPRSFVIIYD